MQSLLKDKIDKKRTIDNVKVVMDKYQYYRLSEPEIREPKITPAWANIGMPLPNTNGFHSDTESCAVFNVDGDPQRRHFINRVHAALSRLSIEDQQIIKERYMQRNETTNTEVYMKLNYSERNYYYKRDKAFVRLACALRIEAYKDV